jgi:magnesium chelatase family protein
MAAIVATVAYLGLEARAVEVQVQLIPGLPAFNLVGLGDKAVGESRERVRGAIAAMGLALPPKRIAVNLSPADLPKEGSHFDLPVALGLLAAMGMVDAELLAEYVIVGELTLDGRIAPSPGVLLAALHAAEVGKGLICPAAQGAEAAWASSVEVVAAPDLLGLINHLKGHGLLATPRPGDVEAAGSGPDLRQVRGQETAKRALEIAASGGHNLLTLWTEDPCVIGTKMSNPYCLRRTWRGSKNLTPLTPARRQAAFQAQRNRSAAIGNTRLCDRSSARSVSSAGPLSGTLR